MSKGNALTVVLFTITFVSLLVVTVLYVSGVGRDVTSHYINYTGVYDLAVAGNEHAFLIFKDVLENPEKYEDEETTGELGEPEVEGESVKRNTLNGDSNVSQNDGSSTGINAPEENAPKEDGIALDTIADMFINALTENEFEQTASGYELTWNVGATTDIEEIFTGTTTVVSYGSNFSVTTVIRKTLNGKTSYPATVLMEIEWPPEINYFDGSKLPVLKSKRI